MASSNTVVEPVWDSMVHAIRLSTISPSLMFGEAHTFNEIFGLTGYADPIYTGRPHKVWLSLLSNK
jgi:hypothetical protein